jgi:hypothetical protein
MRRIIWSARLFSLLALFPATTMAKDFVLSDNAPKGCNVGREGNTHAIASLRMLQAQPRYRPSLVCPAARAA